MIFPHYGSLAMLGGMHPQFQGNVPPMNLGPHPLAFPGGFQGGGFSGGIMPYQPQNPYQPQSPYFGGKPVHGGPMPGYPMMNSPQINLSALGGFQQPQQSQMMRTPYLAY